MNSWFTVKVKYTKQLENGTFKRVSEPYLLAAMSFTDAEARIYDELGNTIRGEFNVTNIARTDYHDIFQYDDCDTWYKCKIMFESAAGEEEKSKKVTQNFLVSANSVKEAYERLGESLASMMVDFVIPSITVSPIVDIFPFTEEMDREISRRPIEEASFDDEPVSVSGKPVFSAPGSDVDEDEDFENEEADSEIEDEYSAE
jgi:hypothetical protein